jgi:hypothetical protein
MGQGTVYFLGRVFAAYGEFAGEEFLSGKEAGGYE